MEVVGIVLGTSSRIISLIELSSKLTTTLKWQRAADAGLSTSLTTLLGILHALITQIKSERNGYLTDVDSLTQECENTILVINKLLDDLKPDPWFYNHFRTRFQQRKKIQELMACAQIIIEQYESLLQQIVQKLNTEQLHQIQDASDFASADDRRVYRDLTNFRHVSQSEVLDQTAVAASLLAQTKVGMKENKAPEGKIIQPQIQRRIQELLLKWLGFASMSRRLEDIPQSYGNTFEWIFDPEPRNRDDFYNFREWLGKPDSGLYWVRGREGSGKSTLMKSIWQSPKTREYLKPWQGPSELLTAAFSLWKVGSSLAKSQVGLLRSLLYALLSQKPELGSLAFSYNWARLYRSLNGPNQEPCKLEPPTVAVLMRALKRITSSQGGSLKIFLLVDGLDEYEGSIDETVQLCQDIAPSSNVKIVFSSREIGYEAFTQAFAGKPGLQLDMLNRKDIEAFVKESLDSTAHGILSTDDRATLARYVSQASGGLFIWANLVVPSLVNRASGGDSLTQLQERLQGTLGGLPSLYDELFQRIPEDQKNHVSKWLQILLEWSHVQTLYSSESEGLDSIPLLDFCLADGKMAEVLDGIPPSAAEIAAKCKSTQALLWSRCSNFVRVRCVRNNGTNVGPSQTRVELSHRTVLDYFTIRVATLQQLTKEMEFSPSLSLLKSVVHRLQMEDVPGSRQLLWNFATAAFVYANHIEHILAGQHKLSVQERTSPEDADTAAEGPSDPYDSSSEDNREVRENEIIHQEETKNERNYIKLLIEFDKSMQKHHKTLLKIGDTWIARTYCFGSRTKNDKGWQSKQLARVHWSNFHPTAPQLLSYRSDFLSLAVQFGLLRYVSHRLDKGSNLVRAKKGRPLLQYALCPIGSDNHKFTTIKMVKKLLENGARPNDRFRGCTCWEAALAWEDRYFESFSSNRAPRELERYVKTRLKIFSLLLENGANPHAQYCLDAREKTMVSFEDFLTKHFQKHKDVDPEAFDGVKSKASKKTNESWKPTRWLF